MSALTYRLIQLCLVLAIGGAIAFALYWYVLAPKPDTELISTAADFAQYQVMANVHRSRMQSYEGVCTDLYFPAHLDCTSTAEAYAIVTRMSDGGYYCADSSGYAGEQVMNRLTPTTCQ